MFGFSYLNNMKVVILEYDNGNWTNRSSRNLILHVKANISSVTLLFNSIVKSKAILVSRPKLYDERLIQTGTNGKLFDSWM